ncbi:DUF6207 family protein [Streptomyces sp. NPDC048611]|uniref:DUF6207 family protein n=1 Tax=Streptomyces sp. NPDC048611 TaxID=3155635 RepID=UPI003430FCE8
MKISEEHLSELGLVVIDITAADEVTANEAAAALGGLWLSSGPSGPWRTPGEAGITVRIYADLRRAPLSAAADPTPVEDAAAVPQRRAATASPPTALARRALPRAHQHNSTPLTPTSTSTPQGVTAGAADVLQRP